MTTPIDQSLLALRSVQAVAAIESLLLDSLTDDVVLCQAISPFYIPEELDSYAQQFGIPVSRVFSIKAHSHPLHASYRNLWHSVILPSLITSPCTVSFCKENRFSTLVAKSKYPLTLRNVITTPRDLTRYPSSTLSSFVHTLGRIDTPSLLLAEALHYFSPENIAVIFQENPSLNIILGTAIIPPESLTVDYSLHPLLYSFAVSGSDLIYFPENDLQNSYVQPLAGNKWLMTKRICTPSFVLTVELVTSHGPFHTFMITSFPLAVPRFRLFPTLDLMPLPRVRRHDDSAGALVPVFLFRSVLLYLRSLTKPTLRDVAAKVRQFKGSLNDSTLPYALLESIIDVCWVLHTHRVQNTSDVRIHTSFLSFIKYNTVGLLYSLTFGRLDRKWLKRFNSLLADSSLNPVPLIDVHVSTTSSSYYFDVDPLSTSPLKTGSIIISRLRSLLKGEKFVDSGVVVLSDPTTVSSMRLRPGFFTPRIAAAVSAALILNPTPPAPYPAPVVPSAPLQFPLYPAPPTNPLPSGLLHQPVSRDSFAFATFYNPTNASTTSLTFAPCSPHELGSFLATLNVHFNGIDAFQPFYDLYLQSEDLDATLLGYGLPCLRDLFLNEEGLYLSPSAVSSPPLMVESLPSRVVPSSTSPMSVDRVSRRLPSTPSSTNIHYDVNALPSLFPSHPSSNFSDVPPTPSSTTPSPLSDIHTGLTPAFNALTLDPSSEDGLLHCPDHDCYLMLGNSGPHFGITPALPCGCPSALPGNHVVNPALTIVSRGSGWFVPQGGVGDNGRIPPSGPSFALSVTYPDPSLRGVAYVDALFPATVGCRWNASYVGRASALRCSFPPITSQDCLLAALHSGTGLSCIYLWRILCSLTTSNTRNALLTPDSFLNLFHLEILALYLNLNVQLVCSRAALGSFPHKYGVKAGRVVLLRWNGSDHFSYDPTDQPAHATRAFRQFDPNFVPNASPLALELRDALPTEFKLYSASSYRAEQYIRALRFGTTGTIKLSRDEFDAIEKAIDVRLNKKNVSVNLSVIYGDAGCGKTFPFTEVLRRPKWHKGHLFMAVVPTTVLRADWSKALDLRLKKGPRNKGSPSHFLETFENSLFLVAEVIIIDEITKYPPGFVDLLIAMNSRLHTLVVLGGLTQTGWHEPKLCDLNNRSVIGLEHDWFAQHCTSYLRGTRRNCQVIATFLNTPTTVKTVGRFTFGSSILPSIPILVPSASTANDVTALFGLPSYTVNSSQGCSYTAVQIYINRTALTFADSAFFYTALTRAREHVHIIFDFANDHVSAAKIRASPFLRLLHASRHSTPGSFLTHVNSSGHTVPSIINLDAVFCDVFRSLPCPFKLAMPLADITNLDHITLHPSLVPSGGLHIEGVYGDDFVQPKAFWSMLRDVPPASVDVPEPHVLEPISRVHFAPAEEKAFKELIDAQVPDRYDQELVGANTLMSTQKFDGMVLRKDWQELAVLLKLPLDEARDDPRLYVDTSYLTPYHSMDKKDSVAFKAGVKKRITFGSPSDNQRSLKDASLVGNRLFRALEDVIPALRSPIPFSPALQEQCVEENEVNRLKVKGATNLRNFRARAEPEWEENFVDLAAKSELKMKDEKRFKEAIPLQTLITAHDSIFHRLGWVARYISHRILDMLPPHLMLYLGKSPADLDAFCKRFWVDRVSSWNDFTAYDQGQDASFLRMELTLMERLCLPQDVIDYYSWLKTSTFSRLGSFAIMRFTGEVFTFIFNSLANIAVSSMRYYFAPGRACMFGGDDSCFNYVPVERPDWLFFSSHLTLQFKTAVGSSPEFVSWRLTSFGIFKSPILLWTRLCARRAQGLYREVALNYLYEFAFGYRLGDYLLSFCNDLELDACSLLSRFFLRQRSLPLNILTDGMDALKADVPSHRSLHFYSDPAGTLKTIIDAASTLSISLRYESQAPRSLSSYLNVLASAFWSATVIVAPEEDEPPAPPDVDDDC